MYFIKVLIFIFIGGLFFSCGKKVRESYDFLTSTDSLPSIIGLPTDMKIYKDRLFLVDMFNGNSLITAYDLKTKKICMSIGKRGDGPEDFLHISNLDLEENEDSTLNVYAFDPVKMRLHRYKYDLLSGNILLNSIKTIKTGGIGLYDLYRLENGYISTGKMDDNKYILFSDSFDILKCTGEYRPKPVKNISDMVHRRANNGKLQLSNDKKNMVELVYNASVLSLYNLVGNDVQKKWEYIIKELDYRVNGNNYINDSVIGYLSAALGDKYIYALYSGKKENLDAIATYGNEIHVYDYSGNLIKKMMLKKSAFLISVDEEKETIYALGHHPESMVVIYSLPEIL